ncbi:hypothetical protein ACHWQZ_G003882 [Mnemiopsis leidyi]
MSQSLSSRLNSPSSRHSISASAHSVSYFSTLLPVHSSVVNSKLLVLLQHNSINRNDLTNYKLTKHTTGDNDNAGQDSTGNSSVSGTVDPSPRNTGTTNSKTEGPSDIGGDDDDDDDDDKRDKRSSLKLDLISDPDSDKDEETEPDSDDEYNDQVRQVCRRLTPTEESLLMSDPPPTPTHHIDRCPIIPGMSDHCTIFRNISSTPLTSVSGAKEPPSRDIYVHKLMFPSDAADVVLNSIEENVPFTKHGKPTGNSHSVDRDELLDSIEPETPLAILCLGEQRPLDLIPRTTASSVLGKATVGRIFADHGSGIFISKRALKRYQPRSEFGPSLVGNHHSSSFRMVFFTSASLDDTFQWSDLSPEANDSTLPAVTINPLCHRMAQVPFYRNIIDTKLGEKPLTEILKALNQPIVKGDSKEDKKIRVLALLSNPNTVVPADVIRKLTSRLLSDNLSTELSALNLSTKGDLNIRKNRLNDFFSQQAAEEPPSQDVCNSEPYFEYSPPPTQENQSPVGSTPNSGGFRFTGPTPSKYDFLKVSQQQKSKKPSLGKRKRETTTNSGNQEFSGLQAYIESLNSAKDHNLDQELEYLNLKRGGSAKVKRKRISQFVLNTATATPSNLDNRLDILEKTNLTILDRLDHISKAKKSMPLASSVQQHHL